MSHTVKLYNIHGRFVEESYPTILEAMKAERVFEVTECDGEFTLEECCDNNFAVTLTREQLRALAAELTELAQPLAQVAEQNEHEYSKRKHDC